MKFCLWFSAFPLSRAEHRRGGRIKARGLSERSEFPRAPAVATTRRAALRGPRDTGVFFWLSFLSRERKERDYL
jgi:hypothetical protein